MADFICPACNKVMWSTEGDNDNEYYADFCNECKEKKHSAPPVTRKNPMDSLKGVTKRKKGMKKAK